MYKRQALAHKISWLRASTQFRHGLFLQATVRVDACAKVTFAAEGDDIQEWRLLQSVQWGQRLLASLRLILGCAHLATAGVGGHVAPELRARLRQLRRDVAARRRRRRACWPRAPLLRPPPPPGSQAPRRHGAGRRCRGAAAGLLTRQARVGCGRVPRVGTLAAAPAVAGVPAAGDDRGEGRHRLPAALPEVRPAGGRGGRRALRRSHGRVRVRVGLRVAGIGRLGRHRVRDHPAEQDPGRGSCLGRCRAGHHRSAGALGGRPRPGLGRL